MQKQVSLSKDPSCKAIAEGMSANAGYTQNQSGLERSRPVGHGLSYLWQPLSCPPFPASPAYGGTGSMGRIDGAAFAGGLPNLSYLSGEWRRWPRLYLLLSGSHRGFCHGNSTEYSSVEIPTPKEGFPWDDL